MSNINDVAKATGVAKSTVSNVFTKKRYVSPEIVDKVMKAAKELDFTPNYFASNILETNTNIVGVFLEADNDTYYPFYNLLIQSLVVNGRKYGKQVMVYFNPRGGDFPELLRVGRSPLCGAVLLSPNFEDIRLERLNDANIPYVVIGRPGAKESAGLTVDVDNVRLVKTVLNHLYSRGHRSILFANSNPTLTVSQDRDEAVAQKLVEYPELQVQTLHLKNEAGTIEEYLGPAVEGGVTAVVCSSEIIALDVYRYAEQRGLTVGGELSVVSLGGNTFSDRLKPALTRAVQNYGRIGEECIKLLMRRLEDPQFKARRVLSCGLYLGESVADLTAR